MCLCSYPTHTPRVCFIEAHSRPASSPLCLTESYPLAVRSHWPLSAAIVSSPSNATPNPWVSANLTNSSCSSPSILIWLANQNPGGRESPWAWCSGLVAEVFSGWGFVSFLWRVVYCSQCILQHSVVCFSSITVCIQIDNARQVAVVLLC